jgi:geranylgeranyl reductase family protein
MNVEGNSEVLIIGAGPTGCAAGIVLRRAGIDVCVVDSALFPRDKVCGDAVSNAGMHELDMLGAAAAVRQGPHALVQRAAAVFPDGTRIERRYDAPGFIVPRRHLDDCLRRTLESHGARLVQDCKVSELLRQDGRVLGAIGPKLRWSAKLVIAADGYGSVGLKALGVAEPRGRHLAVAATAYYRGVSFPDGPDAADHYFEHELPYGYGWIFPAVDGVSNVGVYIRADAYANSGEKLAAMMAAFCARHATRFAAAQLVGKLRSWSLPLAPRPLPVTGPGLLLAGDAAGFIDPLSGEGIWQGLHSGMLVGETAASAIRAGELSPTLQRSYERSCKRAIAWPSRRKAWVQHAMEVIIKRRLYTNFAVRAALRWGYEHQALEMTKN